MGQGSYSAVRLPRRRSSLLFIGILAVAIAAAVLSQHVLAQGDSQLLLRLAFENSLGGQLGETPSAAAGVSYEAGALGQGAFFGPGNRVLYPSRGNISATEGTLEFWLKPRWRGGDGRSHTILSFGGGGGLLFTKDGANNLRVIGNRFGIGGRPEVGVAVNVSSWRADQWHHVAYTWSSAGRRLALYVDGTLVGTSLIPVSLPAISAPTFQIGAEEANDSLNGVLDELQISGNIRSDGEIARSYLGGLAITSLAVQPAELQLMETWRRMPAVTAETAAGVVPVPPAAATWASSDAAVATVDTRGYVRALAAGTATLTASVAGAQASMKVTVTAPVRPPEVDSLDAALTTSAPGHLWEMPVAIIRYLPTRDGVNVDASVADWKSTLPALKQRIDQLNRQTKFMLEEGSRFHGYKEPSAKPSLGYRVVQSITVYEPLPPDLNPAHSTGGRDIYFPDYEQILERFQAEHLVRDLGVKEFWIWGYHFKNIAPVESNMSSPITGDVSNSFRHPDDLPVYDRSYTLYNYNFTRTANESVHNHGHQLEAILGHVNQLQDGNTNLFWKKFAGQNAGGAFITGRCGWTHMPPNTTKDYDYWNRTPVLSDIEDWTPDNTGAKTMVSADTWGGITYAWPDGRIPEDPVQHNWYVYWMQNMPGRDNTIKNGAGTLNNWWAFTGDWDASVRQVSRRWGLYRLP